MITPNFLNAIASGKLPMDHKSFFRVILVGDALAGKTSIVRALVRGKLDPNDVSTVSAVVHTVAREIHGKSVVMQLWDTAGAEKYRSISPSYYRNAAAAVAVFDMQDDDFTDKLDSWIVSVKRNSVDPQIFVVGNKTDLVKPTEQMFQTVKEFAERYNAQFFFVSAKSGENINLLFDAIFEELYKTLVTPMDLVVEEVQPGPLPQPPAKYC
jgi:small GTP-binding protein